MAEFEGAVAFVTGAGGGIGRSFVDLFERNGGRVFAVDRAAASAARPTVNDENPAGFKLWEADVADPSSIERAVSEAVAVHGRLDFAVNCAGVEQTPTMISDTTVAEMSRVIDINLKGNWLSMRAELPEIRKTRGAIVNIASFWGEVGMAGGSSYAAAKGGIIALTRAMAAEEGANGVRVNCISPGAIKTPMLDRVVAEAKLDIDAWARERTLAGHVADPEDVAELIAFLCSKRARYLTGQNLLLDGGYTII